MTNRDFRDVEGGVANEDLAAIQRIVKRFQSEVPISASIVLDHAEAMAKTIDDLRSVLMSLLNDNDATVSHPAIGVDRPVIEWLEQAHGFVNGDAE